MLQATTRLYRNAYAGLPAAIWWLSVVVFINRCGTMVLPFLTVYLLEKGYTLVDAGLMLTSFGLGSIVGAYAGGRLTDRIGFLNVQTGSLLVSGFLFIVLGYMQTLWQIGICMFVLSSIGEAFRPANSAAIAAYSTEENRTRSYSLNRLAINLGFGIGPAIGGILADRNFILLFWIDGITCMGAALALYLLFPGGSRAAAKKKADVPPNPVTAYSDRPFLWSMFFTFLAGLCFFQMFSIFPAYLREVLHYSKGKAGWLLGLNGLIIAAFEMILVFSLEKKRSGIVYIIAGSLLIGAGFLLLNIAPVLAVVLCMIVLVTAGEMLLYPFLNTYWVKRSRPYNIGQYAGVYTISFSLAIVLAPTFASQVATRYGFNRLWILDFCICALAALGFFVLSKRTPTNE